MQTIDAIPIRGLAAAVLVSAVLAASAAPASAQIGVGARLAWVTPDSDVDADRVRFVGGQIRLLSPRWGLEVAMDRHSEEFPLFNEKVIETPLQTSLLLRMGRGKVRPFLLAGPGWYRRKVEALDVPGDTAVATTEFGWHAGVGLEVLAGRHFGVHGDYRYTFLDFNGDDDKDEGFIRRLLPGHRGSMWTLGASVYF
jgi:Outer membrane protein beta-barrel domain